MALPALADSGVPMDLGPLGLRNGGSGKLNSCPPQGIKRACISTSKFDTDLYVPPWTYQSAKPDGQGGYAMTGGDSKSVEQAFSELLNAVAAQPGRVGAVVVREEDIAAVRGDQRLLEVQ
mgnify:CR=1 FL=1